MSRFASNGCGPVAAAREVKEMVNTWGYSTVNFFAPMSRFASNAGGPVAAAREVKEMVKKLHAAGVEVILDVVYNHTNEADDTFPYTTSFRGIDNKTYYIVQPNSYVQLANYAGCGNTLNCNHPVVMQMILDSLRHWVQVRWVDGKGEDEGVGQALIVGACETRCCQSASPSRSPELWGTLGGDGLGAVVFAPPPTSPIPRLPLPLLFPHFPPLPLLLIRPLPRTRCYPSASSSRSLGTVGGCAVMLLFDRILSPILFPPPLPHQAIAKDEVLSKCKLIAEPWDCGGLYQVGSFPNWDRWAEWNGKYRDDVRKFIKGDEGMKGPFATRLAGSADMYHVR
ncbi:unnamed protein product [Closterium sp. NIES-54]